MKNFLRGALFRLESELVRTLYRWSGSRPSSQPFLSGDGYRSLADHRYETGHEYEFFPDLVQSGHLVYCEAGKIREFFQGPACRVKEPFVLVTCNGDVNVGEELWGIRPSQLVHWFAQNTKAAIPGLLPLPIGLENRNLHWHGVTRDFVRLRRALPEKVPKVLFGFSIQTNPSERQEALDALRASPVAEELENRLNSRLYRETLSRYQFVASPPGNGLDCHRTWEALYLRVIPIVKRSAAAEGFIALGFPLILVDSWIEVSRWSETFMRERYLQLAPQFDCPPMSLVFWAKKFRESGMVLS